MKKWLLLGRTALLVACSTPMQQSSVPLDTKAVADYQQRIHNAEAGKATADKVWELNQSDKRPKVVKVVVRPYPYASPSVYYGWGRSGYGHYSGVGIRLGYD